MSTYLVGDVHGCFDELQTLLLKVKFNLTTDSLWLTGDLVGRGPHSLEVLHLVRNLGTSARVVLGNHDINLLAVYAGVRRCKPKDNFDKILQSPDVNTLTNWLRCQPMIQIDKEKKLIMTHAGISPQWDLTLAKRCSEEITKQLSQDSYPLFLKMMFRDKPNIWHNHTSYLARLRFSINAFTRMRYCFPNGRLDLKYKGVLQTVPEILLPWFVLPRKVPQSFSIIFGHWAALLGKGTPVGIYGLDTGCIWGGKLTLLRWEDKSLFQVSSRLRPP